MIKIKNTSVTRKSKKLGYKFGNENPETILSTKLDFGGQISNEKEAKTPL